MAKKKNKKGDDFSPYCPVCGGCGFVGCCGIRNFLEKHVRGKTNCQEEDNFIRDIINCCEGEGEG